MASDEAVLQGREIGVEFMQRGYRFLDFDPFLEVWNKREDDHIFRERYFSEGINFEIKLENNEIEEEWFDGDDFDTDNQALNWDAPPCPAPLGISHVIKMGIFGQVLVKL